MHRSVNLKERTSAEAFAEASSWVGGAMSDTPIDHDALRFVAALMLAASLRHPDSPVFREEIRAWIRTMLVDLASGAVAPNGDVDEDSLLHYLLSSLVRHGEVSGDQRPNQWAMGVMESPDREALLQRSLDLLELVPAQASTVTRPGGESPGQPGPTRDLVDPVVSPRIDKSVPELQRELDTLIGLREVKTEIRRQVAVVQLDVARRRRGLRTAPQNRHMMFTGDPGTGKSTVARYVASLYAGLGVLSGGQTVEVDRALLVGQYLGHTARQTWHVIDAALGGVLFIDEAYSLVGPGDGRGPDSFGQEAVDTLVKAMEDHRDEFVLILAGYPDRMQRLLAVNPGLRSRVGIEVEFRDYQPVELWSILLELAERHDYRVDPTFRDAAMRRLDLADDMADFANARSVRNLFEAAVRVQSHRLASRAAADPSALEDADLRTLTREDLVTALDSVPAFTGVVSGAGPGNYL